MGHANTMLIAALSEYFSFECRFVASYLMVLEPYGVRPHSMGHKLPKPRCRWEHTECEFLLRAISATSAQF
jgi:hypothetical protein